MSSLLFWTETHGHVHLRSQGLPFRRAGLKNPTLASQRGARSSSSRWTEDLIWLDSDDASSLVNAGG